MRTHHLGLLVCALALAAPSAFAQGMHKCKDSSGKITYSDQLCPSVSGPSDAPKAALVNKTSDGKLTEAGVLAVHKYAIELGQAHDYRGQCALAAPDISYSFSDLRKTPPLLRSGGRSVFCAAQRDAAARIQASGATIAAKYCKPAITVSADGRSASLTLDTSSSVRQHGHPDVVFNCSHDQVLAVHGDSILYAKVHVSCKEL